MHLNVINHKLAFTTLTMKHILLYLLLACSFLNLSAQTDTANVPVSQSPATISSDSAAMATVYVFRSTGHVASAVNLRVVVDDVMKCKVKNNRYAVLQVEPGTHMFNATSWDKPGTPEKFGIKLPVEAGKTYYMSMRIKQKFMGVEIFMEEVTKNTAEPLLEKYKKDECD